MAGAGISDLDPPAVFAHDMVLRLVVLHRDCSEVVDLARRLHAIARGEPDPGQDVRFEPLDINSLNVEFTLDAQTETASATIRDAAGNLVEEMTWSLEPSID